MVRALHAGLSATFLGMVFSSLRPSMTSWIERIAIESMSDVGMVSIFLPLARASAFMLVRPPAVVSGL